MKKSLALIFSFLLVFLPPCTVLAEEVFDEAIPPEEYPLEADESFSDSSETDPESDPDAPEVLFVEYDLILNEILADPKENDGENEFIEIYNVGTEAVDLAGWRLDDARADDGAYDFLNETLNYVLEPDAYLILFRPETGITLNNDTDAVILSDAEGNIVDSFEFDSQGAGRSWGRNPENTEEWLVFKNPTPGESNVIEPNKIPVAVIEIQKDTRHMKLNVTGSESFDPDGDKLTFLWEFEAGFYDERENPLIYTYEQSGEKTVKLRVTDSYGDFGEAEIVFAASPKGSGGGSEAEVYPIYDLINEVMPSPEGSDEENEWVEFYNPNQFGIDLSEWYIDDAEGKSRPYKIPEATIIMPNSYLVFSGPDLGLSFKNSDDVVRVLDPNKNLNQEVSYTEAVENWTYARRSGDLYEWTPLFTPGGLNEFPPPPRSYQPGDVVFESVLPNPEGEDAGNEKITLRNTTTEPVSLAGWTILDAGGSEKPLPDLIIESDGSLVLSSSDFRVTLNNSDESLTLFDATGNFIDEIKWKSSSSGTWLFNPDALKEGMQAEVLRAVDGDTLVIGFDDKKLTVRLIGVDTPETVHPFKPVEYFGKQASAFLSSQLTGQSVTLEFDDNKIDKYGRVLAYVFVGDEMINRTIISQGYGYAYTRFPFIYLEDFVSLQDAAKAAGLGLWQNGKVGSLLQELVDEEMTELTEMENEDFLLLLEESPEKELEEPGEAERITESLSHGPDCSSPYLYIDSFLPAPKRGDGVEYIKLVNTGPETVCLYGWMLDDDLDIGSDPYAIPGGAIAPGATRTFRKSETGLSLNNTTDCVNLLDPWGMLVDQICYEKTHQNELFNHTGGNWLPKARSKKKTASSVSVRHKFSRTLISYQSDLSTASYTGMIMAQDDDAREITMRLQDKKQVLVSYASSPVNIEIARELIDFSQPVRIQVYESADFRNLLSIEQAEYFPVGTEEASSARPILLFAIILSLSSSLIYKVCPKSPQKRRR